MSDFPIVKATPEEAIYVDSQLTDFVCEQVPFTQEQNQVFLNYVIYEAHKADTSLPTPSQVALRRQLNSVKRQQFPWMLEVTKNAPQMAIIQLGVAFKNFFEGHADYPRFRRRGVHELTTELTSRFNTIVIEDLNVKGMMQNRHMSRAVADMGFYEFRRQLDYKAASRGGLIVVADRWFASSKICKRSRNHSCEFTS